MINDLLSIYAAKRRTALLVLAGALIAGIAIIDYVTKPYFSLGFLYLFPIMIIGGFARQWQTIGVALTCAVLQEAFSNLPGNEAVVRVLLGWVGFSGIGLFISEAVRNRQIVLRYVSELEEQERRPN